MDELEPGHDPVKENVAANEVRDHEDNKPGGADVPGKDVESHAPSQSDAPDTTEELVCELNDADESNKSDETEKSNKPHEHNIPDSIGESQQSDVQQANAPIEAETANTIEREVISLEFNSSLVQFTNMFPHLDIKLIEQVCLIFIILRFVCSSIISITFFVSYVGFCELCMYSKATYSFIVDTN